MKRQISIYPDEDLLKQIEKDRKNQMKQTGYDNISVNQVILRVLKEYYERNPPK